MSQPYLLDVNNFNCRLYTEVRKMITSFLQFIILIICILYVFAFNIPKNQNSLRNTQFFKCNHNYCHINNNRNDNINNKNSLSMMASSGGNLNSGAIKMIKKAKMKEISKIQTAIDENDNTDPTIIRLKEYIKTKQLSEYIGSKHEDFYTSVVDRYDTLNVIPNYEKKTKTGFILGIPNPDIMGGVLRDAGSRSIVVSMDPRAGGVSPEEFARFTREQQRARTFIPGPIPVIWHDFIVDSLQITLAASCGAAAITLSPELFIENDSSSSSSGSGSSSSSSSSSSSLKEQVDLCKSLNVEPVIFVKSETEVQTALDAGARVMILNNIEVKEALRIKKAFDPDRIVRNSQYNEIVWGMRLRPVGEFSCVEEIDMAWELRDSGFHFVWPSMEALYAMGMEDVYSTIMAMKSKASKEFISPRQFLMDRKKEGAKEYLGDILF